MGFSYAEGRQASRYEHNVTLHLVWSLFFLVLVQCIPLAFCSLFYHRLPLPLCCLFDSIHLQD
jgi:hypothetical protein